MVCLSKAVQWPQRRTNKKNPLFIEEQGPEQWVHSTCILHYFSALMGLSLIRERARGTEDEGEREREVQWWDMSICGSTAGRTSSPPWAQHVTPPGFFLYITHTLLTHSFQLLFYINYIYCIEFQQGADLVFMCWKKWGNDSTQIVLVLPTYQLNLFHVIVFVQKILATNWQDVSGCSGLPHSGPVCKANDQSLIRIIPITDWNSS